MMQDELKALQENALRDAENAADIAALDAVRVRYLGKKGELTAVLRQMGKLSAEERPLMGALGNTVRDAIEAVLVRRDQSLGEQAIAKKLAEETVDVTLPGQKTVLGHRHPMNIVLDDLKRIFLGMGFSIAEGPEAETTYYCFDALRTGPNHPARDLTDTLYLSPDVILRTQTSSVQVRTMEVNKPPIRIISPGAAFRKDELDATHSPAFRQVEALVVDEGISMSDLKGTLQTMMEGLYGPDVKLRFRPHHFPYTEPSAEVDLQCFACHGEGCRLCKYEGYIEMLGSGMVHPWVLQNCGIDPERYSGFAFGVGIERLTLMRYHINDMRLLFENDVRFLEQFS